MNENSGPIKRGTLILTDKPFAAVLHSKFVGIRCDNCFKRAKLLKCSACQYVYYCDRSCQKEAWSVHKLECHHMKKMLLYDIPRSVLLMARIIFKLQRGGAKQIGYYDGVHGRRFADLMSHSANINKDTKRMTDFANVCAALRHYLDKEMLPSTAELLDIYGKLSINGFSIVDDNMNSLGDGIYLGASILDHSCKPNVIATFEGTTLNIRTLEDLPHLDWSKIKVTYVDVLQTTKVRRTELQQNYYFWCMCEKCKKQDVLEDAMACVNKSCTYPCSPGATYCNECQTLFPEDAERIYDEVSEFTAAKIEVMLNMPYFDVCKVCLEKQEGILHPFNLLHVQTLDLAVTSAMKLKLYDEAERYAEELLPCFLYYLGEIHALTGLLYYALARVQLYKKKMILGIDNLRRAKKILTITHGDRNSLFDGDASQVLHLADMREALGLPLPQS